MYQLLIFDWDGTLIDSEGRIISSMQAAAADLTLPKPSDAAVRNIIGLGLPEAILAIYPDADTALIEALRDRYAHYFLSADPTETHLFPGVRETLQSLAKTHRLAVATGKSRKGLNRALTETGLGSLFEITRCADETTSKPDPHMLEEIIWMTDVSSKAALMIGDTEYDLEMGQRAGMDTLAVTYGAHEVERLLRWKPVHQIDEFSELQPWLGRLNSGTQPS
ncbi:HAD-IA family hydrolase [Nitrincola tapanii]|uniref:HAD family hydrolase n=1 Tax=Nitrincola tapanii TaxID=1708751 RepID=A0A5A9W5L6_9GAMM|nr:HAD-IA family hydrolase [Nitrincola tapanii]KAA0875465.1 HAD family hydrolase [Nitrincola tapanii]